MREDMLSGSLLHAWDQYSWPLVLYIEEIFIVLGTRVVITCHYIHIGGEKYFFYEVVNFLT